MHGIRLHGSCSGHGLVGFLIDELAVACGGIFGEDGGGETRSEVGQREDDHKGEEPAQHDNGMGVKWCECILRMNEDELHSKERIQ